METKKYNPPGLALDLCLFTIVDKQEENPKKIPEKELKFLALKRLKEPYKGMYTLAGCAAVEGEKTAETLKKKLKEKSGINTDEIYMEIGGVFDDPKRDKRGHVVSITYLGLCRADKIELKGDAEWINVDYALEKFKDKMAFDHYEILLKIYKLFIERVWKDAIILNTLPELFTQYQLQLSYAAVGLAKINGTDQNFRRKIAAKEWIEKTDIKEESVISRNKAFYYKRIK